MPNLNPEQQLVVEHGRGPLRVAACAGSGKTTAIVERIAWLVKDQRVDPKKILAISFSAAAAQQLATRVNARIPGYDAGDCSKTFHSVALRIFKSEAKKKHWIDNTGAMYAIATARACTAQAVPGQYRDVVRAFASLVKNHMLDIPAMRRLGSIPTKMRDIAATLTERITIDPDTLIRSYLAAEQIRQQDGVPFDGKTRVFITFDDMLFECALMLQREHIREKWARRWNYIIQDEAQDENIAQAQIAEALCRQHRNYIVVGDPSQSIYAFRGSTPERLLEFEETWPDQRTIVMHRNYRSGIEIVNVANRIIDNMPASTVVTDDLGCVSPMLSERKSHAYVAYQQHGESEDSEAHAIARNCVAHFRNGMKWNDQAVLVRMNFMTRAIEVALARQEVPYRLVSGASFFTERETQTVVAHMRIAEGRADQEDVKLALRSLPFMSRDAADSIADNEPSDWLEALKALCEGRAATNARRYSAKSLSSYVGKLEDARKSTDLIESVKDICSQVIVRVNPSKVDSSGEHVQKEFVAYAEQFGSLRELLDDIDHINRHRQRYARSPNTVTVSTVHRAKGREWPVVYIAQMVDGLFPAARASVNEERRLFYVAITRAKDELWISSHHTSRLVEGEESHSSVSPFLYEIDMDEPSIPVFGKQVETSPVGSQLGLGLE